MYNFVITNKDILNVGFVWAMFGGLIGATQVLNRDLGKEITNLSNELEEQSKKKVD